MSFGIRVEGGTRAGTRRVRQAHRRWFCNCETGDGMKLNPGYLKTCAACKAARP